MLPIIRARHALLVTVVMLSAIGVGANASAQSDPPGRVARLNYISGQVSFRPASLDEWGVATINYPVTTGDHLWTDRDASAELHVGSSVLRLAPETAFAFLDLTDDVLQARVAEGTIDVRVREFYSRDVYEVDTPNAVVSILAAGIYRIDVDPEGDRMRVTVRTGEAEVNANGRTFSVYPGQMAEVIGVEDAAYDLGRAPSPDRWELWCRDRDRRDDNRVALTYVSRDMTGYEDLDDYGTWSYETDYGYGWTPTVVAVDWAPYRYGHWTWVRPWGWTWVDHYRWGFAPFHYGRWAYCHERWMWFPGQRVARPVWAPALVAFVGGSNWSFSFGWGARASAIGWFPLAPGELYCPLYHTSPYYMRNINVAHVTPARLNAANHDVSNVHYANRNVTGAMTAVPRDVFVGAQAVNRSGVAVPRQTAAQTPVVGHAAAVTPNATSVFGRTPPAAPRPPASVMKRAVLARNEPPSDATKAAPVVALSRRPAPTVATADTDRAGSAETPRGDSERVQRPGEGVRAGVPSRIDTTGANDSGRARARSEMNNDRPRPATADRYAVPRIDSGGSPSGSSRPAAAPTVSRPAEPASGTWMPTTRTAQPEPAPRYERSVPRDERPVAGYERATPREERPTPSSSHETSAARPRGDDRAPAPARVERAESPRAETPRAEPRAPSGGPSSSSARPAERGSDRPQPSSGANGRGGQAQSSGQSQSGGQAQGSARPRGGRGGQ